MKTYSDDLGFGSLQGDASRGLKITTRIINAGNKSTYAEDEIPNGNPVLHELVGFYVQARLGVIPVYGDADPDFGEEPPRDELDAAIRAVQAHVKHNQPNETMILANQSWTIMVVHMLNYHLKLHTDIPPIPLCRYAKEDESEAVPIRAKNTKLIGQSVPIQRKRGKKYVNEVEYTKIGVECRPEVIEVMKKYNFGTEDNPIHHDVAVAQEAPPTPTVSRRTGKRRRSLKRTSP